MVLHTGNFGHSCLVTATFKFGGKKRVDHFFGCLLGNEAGRQTNNICIIVLTCELRYLRRPTPGCLLAVMATPLALPQIKMPKETSPFSTALETGCAKSG